MKKILTPVGKVKMNHDIFFVQTHFDLISVLKKIGLTKEKGNQYGSCLYEEFPKEKILELVRSEDFLAFVDRSYDLVEEQGKANDERIAREKKQLEEKEHKKQIEFTAELVRISKLSKDTRLRELSSFLRKDLEKLARAYCISEKEYKKLKKPKLIELIFEREHRRIH